MKKVYLSLIVLVFTVNCSFAQWSTNGTCVYYNGGTVAIGTTTDPGAYYKLLVQGNYALGSPLGGSQGGYLLGGDSGFSYYSNKYSDGFFSLQDGLILIGDPAGDGNQTFIQLDDVGSQIYALAMGGYILSGGNNLQVNEGTSKTALGNAGNGSLFGTGYLGFNAARVGTTSWTVSGDGFHNGGGVIYNGINNGEIYFAPIENTGTAVKTLTDADVKSRIQFRITPTATYAKQIYVETTGWPDFVFKKGYALKPLSEVKGYIDQNQHLPDMPAAAIVEKDGINLGEMNKTLLKKVEELTLYLIQKDDEIKSQQDVNKQQKQINQSQEERLKKLSDQLEALSRQIAAKN